MEDKIAIALEKYPSKALEKISTFILIIALVLWSMQVGAIGAIKEDGLNIAKGIITGILQPDKELLFNLTMQGVPYLLLETVCIAFLGTIVGGVLAIPLAFLSASNVVPRPVAFVVRMLIMAIRTVPAFVYGLMFIRVTGPGPFAGLLSMSFISIGMLCKLYKEAIEDMDTHILESFDALGCTTFEKIRYGIFPQLLPSFLSTLIYRFDMNIRDAAILGLVAAGGIGAPLIFAMSSYRWHEAGAIIIGLAVLIIIIECCSTKLRNKLVG